MGPLDGQYCPPSWSELGDVLETRLLLFPPGDRLATRDFGIPGFWGLLLTAMDSFVADFSLCSHPHHCKYP